MKVLHIMLALDSGRGPLFYLVLFAVFGLMVLLCAMAVVVYLNHR